MKVITILFLLLLTSTAFGELTKEDIRTIIKEENDAFEKRMKEYIDLKIETVNAKIDATNTRIDALDKSLSARIDATNIRIDALDKSFDQAWILIIALIGLITAAVAIPQIIIAYKERDWKQARIEIQQLREQIESMNQ